MDLVTLKKFAVKRPYHKKDLQTLLSKSLPTNLQLRKYISKTTKTSSTSSRLLSILNPRCANFLKTLTLSNLEAAVPNQQKCLRRGLQAFKNLKSLTIKEYLPVKTILSIKELKRLQSLAMCLPLAQFSKSSEIFERLSNLKQIDLTIQSQFLNEKPIDPQIIYQFLTRIGKSNALQSLRLDLTEHSSIASSSVLTKVLLFIQQLKLPRFSILLPYEPTHSFNITKIKDLFSTIDFISFFRFDLLQLLVRSPIYESQQETCQRKLYFQLISYEPFDLSKALVNCPLLKTICIEDSRVLDLPQDFQFQKELKGIVLKGNPELFRNHLNNNSNLRVLQRLVSTMSKIDSLEVFSHKTNIKDAESIYALNTLYQLPSMKGITRLEADLTLNTKSPLSFDSIFKGISFFQTLQKLQLTLQFPTTPSFTFIEGALSSMPNLQSIIFTIDESESGGTLHFISKQELSLKIPLNRLPKIKTFDFFSGLPLTVKCAEHLLKGLKSLEHLEKLHVSGRSFAQLKQDYLTGAIKSLKKMKKVYVEGSSFVLF